jgi:hypothetical protein
MKMENKDYEKEHENFPFNERHDLFIGDGIDEICEEQKKQTRIEVDRYANEHKEEIEGQLGIQCDQKQQQEKPVATRMPMMVHT